MPNDKINECLIPLPHQQIYETLGDLLNQIRNYVREAGFQIIVEGKQSTHFRRIRCTKSIPLTAIENPEDDQDVQIITPTA
jgi:hypothetical protein